MSGLLEALTANSNVQGAGATVLRITGPGTDFDNWHQRAGPNRKTLAGSQVQQWASELQVVHPGSGGPLSIIGRIPEWKNMYELPLPENVDPGQYQIDACSAIPTGSHPAF
jgi:hypothetical protein